MKNRNLWIKIVMIAACIGVPIYAAVNSAGSVPVTHVGNSTVQKPLEDQSGSNIVSSPRRALSLDQLLDHMFYDPFGSARSNIWPERFGNEGFIPSMDLNETKDSYIVKIDVPGIEKQNIKINLEGRRLFISGVRNEQSEEKEGGKLVRQERYSGEFKRVLNLPGPVREGASNAKIENGVLTVTIPKAEPKEDKTVIPIL